MQAVALMRFGRAVRALGLKSVAGVLLALPLKVHLWLFDPVFVSGGSMKQLLKQREHR